jgi:hypothetical protein
VRAGWGSGRVFGKLVGHPSDTRSPGDTKLLSDIKSRWALTSHSNHITLSLIVLGEPLSAA